MYLNAYDSVPTVDAAQDPSPSESKSKSLSESEESNLLRYLLNVDRANSESLESAESLLDSYCANKLKPEFRFELIF